jgi:hypothetical protein
MSKMMIAVAAALALGTARWRPAPWRLGAVAAVGTLAAEAEVILAAVSGAAR